MPDELKPIFSAMKPQLAPDDDLVAKTLAAIEADDTAVTPAPKRNRRFRRWAPPVAAFVAGVGIAALVATSLVANQMTPASRSNSFVANAPAQPQDSAPSENVQPDNSAMFDAYAGLFKTLSDVAINQSPNFGLQVQSGPMTDQGTVTPGASPSTSGTNTQVAGIDEGDIVKTDGRFIYVATGRKVAVVAATGASSNQVATIDTSNVASAGELTTGPVADMMIDGTTLVVLVHAFDVPTSGWTRGGGSFLAVQASRLKAVFYDISDPLNPKLLSSVSQSGAYSTSRLQGDTLYLVSRYTVPMDQAVANQPITYVPSIDTGTGQVPLVPSDVDIMPWISQTVYSVVTAIDVPTRQVTSSLAVLGDSQTVYMSQDNLYLASQQWPGITPLEAQPKVVGDGTRTNIMRISLSGKLTLAAQGSVAGYLVDQFSIDEWGGNLRVVTTWYDAKNSAVTYAGLWVLDASLKTIGSLPKLMTNETVQSARFDAAAAYIVTFRQRDPLFAVDLSHPRSPKVKGTLKINGFSAYLNPFGDGLLLGVGYDANSSGSVIGLKLSMFDIANPYNVTEAANTKFKADQTEVTADHHACFVDAANGLIGFPTITWGSSQKNNVWSQTITWDYRIYSWDGSGFKLRQTVSLYNGEFSYTNDALADPWARGIEVGGSFYVVDSEAVGVYDLAGFTQLAQVTLK